MGPIENRAEARLSSGKKMLERQETSATNGGPLEPADSGRPTGEPRRRREPPNLAQDADESRQQAPAEPIEQPNVLRNKLKNIVIGLLARKKGECLRGAPCFWARDSLGI